MKIEFWLTGKTSYSFIEEGMALYEKRIKRYLPFEVVILPHPKGQLEQAQVKSLECEPWLKRLHQDDYLILLDERGKSYSSEKFATKMEALLGAPHRKIIFLVGGAYGFDEALYKRANEMLSLSQMTLSHQIIRLFLLEQFYRAMTILKNEPYHHS